MQMAAHNQTAFAGTLCFGCTLRQINENGIPLSLENAKIWKMGDDAD